MSCMALDWTSGAHFCSNLLTWNEATSRGQTSCADVLCCLEASDLQTQARAAGVDLSKVEVVLAAECVWLKELVEPFVDTVLGILQAAQRDTPRAGAKEGSNGGAATGPAAAPASTASDRECANEQRERAAVCYCCYRDRAKESSETFAGMAMVVAAFESRGCEVVLEQRLPPLEQVSLGGGGGDILLYRIQRAG